MYNKLPRILITHPIDEEHLIIDGTKAHHLLNVLRVKKGEYMRPFNQETGEFLGLIEEVSKKHITIKIEKKLKDLESRSKITLAFAPIKPDRLKFMIEKCTELGVDGFVPVLTQRTIIRDLKSHKIESYITGATEQSERVSVPFINEITTLTDFLKAHTSSVILCCDESLKDSNFISKHIPKDSEVMILIGPEGGFSEQDRNTMKTYQNIKYVSLGQNILRAETAAIFAITAVLCFNYS